MAAYFRLLKSRKAGEDQARAMIAELEIARREPVAPGDFRKLYEGTFEPPPASWRPPEGSRTFADYSISEARRYCANKPHVLIREDPMFGRRGFAREVLEDPKEGFLVLVIAFAGKKDRALGWIEPHRPRDCERRYWSPSKVEIVPR